MLDPTTLLRTLEEAGFSHVVWIPDSAIGPWESALASSSIIQLIRPAREGEAIALAAGLMIGGARPLVIIQCTGLFEAGDALRNVVHDLNLPLKLLIGVRSYHASQTGTSNDNCPLFTEPILQAWKIPYTLPTSDELLAQAIGELAGQPNAAAVLLTE
jgi:sulfopyruvate decarboxylase TPP-binding subunit